MRGGRPYVEGKGIAVHHIAVCSKFGMSASGIATEYDLTLGDVHAALAYYYDHQREFDDWLREEERLFTEAKAMNPSFLREKLKALLG